MSSHLDQSCLAALPVGSASCCCERMEGEEQKTGGGMHYWQDPNGLRQKRKRRASEVYLITAT